MHDYESIENSNILIVDDDDPIRNLLKFMLQNRFNVKTVESGDAALEIINEFRPDLILLDIMMPGTSGLEVCKQITANSSYFSAPVIFLTVKDDEDDLKEGLEAGAVDYIKKPFSEVELLARVENVLKMSRYFKRMTVMDELKTNFLTMVSHDIKTPLTSIMGYADFLLSEHYTEKLPDKAKTIIKKMLDSANHQYAIIRDLLSFASLDREELKPEFSAFKLKTSMALLKNEFTFKLNDKKMKLTTKCDDTIIFSDKTRIEEVISNIISNGIKFSHDESEIVVTGEKVKDTYYVRIKDEGIGIEEKNMHKLFDKYNVFTTKGTGGETGTGFGLKICKRLIKTLDGDINVTSKAGEGSEFIIQFPVNMENNI